VEGREKDGRRVEEKWRASLKEEGGKGEREMEGPPVITPPPGSRAARIVAVCDTNECHY